VLEKEPAEPGLIFAPVPKVRVLAPRVNNVPEPLFNVRVPLIAAAVARLSEDAFIVTFPKV